MSDFTLIARQYSVFLLVILMLIVSGVVVPDQYFNLPKNTITNLFWLFPFLIILSMGTPRGAQTLNYVNDQKKLIIGFFITVLTYLLAFLIYSNQLIFAIRTIILLILPFLGYAFYKTKPGKVSLFDAFLLTYIFAVLEFKVMPMNVISFSGPPPIFIIDILFLILAIIALFVFIILRKIKNIGYSLTINTQDIKTALMGYFLIFLIVVPLGVYFGFLGFRFPSNNQEIFLSFVYYFFFVALFEELFFRGFILNMLSQSIANKNNQIIALIISSLIFGLTHLNSLDWRYFIFAVISGFFYGLAYLRTNKLTAPIIMHGLVDFTWVLFFYKAVVN